MIKTSKVPLIRLGEIEYQLTQGIGDLLNYLCYYYNKLPFYLNLPTRFLELRRINYSLNDTIDLSKYDPPIKEIRPILVSAISKEHIENIKESIDTYLTSEIIESALTRINETLWERIAYAIYKSDVVEREVFYGIVFAKSSIPNIIGVYIYPLKTYDVAQSLIGIGLIRVVWYCNKLYHSRDEIVLYSPDEILNFSCYWKQTC